MLHGSPWLYTSSRYHQMITQQRPRGRWVLSEAARKECWQTTKSSLVGPHRGGGGGADLGDGTGDPRHCFFGICNVGEANYMRDATTPV